MDCMDLIEKSLEKTQGKSFKGNSWGARHHACWRRGVGTAGAIANLVTSAAAYADEYARHFEGKIGDDGVLGDEWGRILRGIIGLLDGESGNLDCGTVDSLLREMARSQGYDKEL